MARPRRVVPGTTYIDHKTVLPAHLSAASFRRMQPDLPLLPRLECSNDRRGDPYRMRDVGSSLAIQHAVKRAHAAFLAGARAFFGRDAVVGQSFLKREEAFEPRRGPIPLVPTRNGRLLRANLAKYAVLRAAYREALAAWRRNDSSVVFPFGTWAMRLFHGAASTWLPGNGSCSVERAGYFRATRKLMTYGGGSGTRWETCAVSRVRLAHSVNHREASCRGYRAAAGSPQPWRPARAEQTRGESSPNRASLVVAARFATQSGAVPSCHDADPTSKPL